MNDLRWHIGAVTGTRPVADPTEMLPKTLCGIAADPVLGRTLLNSEAVYYRAIPKFGEIDKCDPMWCVECLTVHRASQDPFKTGLQETKQAIPMMTVTGDQLPEPISPPEAIDTVGPHVNEPPFETLPETGVPPGLPARTPLTVHQLLQLGATQPEGRVTSAELKAHLAHQEQVYACYSKEELVAELVRRDAGLIRQGQEAADGKMAGRLLREFVRGILYSADQADLNQTQEMLAKGEQIDTILRMLGADPAPKRDLRVNGGTTLGPIGPVSTIGQSPEEAIQDLSDLSRRQFPSEKAADEIRNRER